MHICPWSLKHICMDNYQELVSSLPLCIKRGPYIKYKQYPDTVQKVMKILKTNINAELSIIALKTGFKLRTLYNWKEKLLKDREYDPLAKQKRMNSRIFSEIEEDGIAEFIWRQKLLPNKCFTDSDCVEILTQTYLEKHQNDENINYSFIVSKGYIYYFKMRHGFVSKLCHLKRRPSINTAIIASFINDMENLFSNVSLHQIINIDETAIFMAPKNLKIWHSRGRDDVIVPVKYNDKERITAACAVGANGRKFNIQFIAKGQTDQVLETQIGDVGPHLRSFSQKGWTDASTFYAFLNYIKSEFDENEEVHIILDTFSAHKAEEIIDSAKELGLVLHFIPPGLTDLYQPLDVKIFAIIKAYLKHMLRTYLRDDREMSKKEACKCMIAAWEKLPIDAVEESFDFLTMEDRWQGVSSTDLLIMHTCRFNEASVKDKKKMIYNEIIENSVKDDIDTPLMKYVIDSFGALNEVSLDHIINFVNTNSVFETDEHVDELINDTINTLISYKIITMTSSLQILIMKKHI